jgi:GNAT superfamily N-acetyltransferase
LSAFTADQVLIRRGLAADSDRLSQIAFQAKAYWGYPADWMERWRYSLTISADYIESNPVYCAVEDGLPIGFYALTGSAQAMTLDHLWVTPQKMRAGFGRLLIEHAFTRADELGARELSIEADPHAESFYVHMGARRVGAYTYAMDGQTREIPRLLIPVKRAEI